MEKFNVFYEIFLFFNNVRLVCINESMYMQGYGGTAQMLYFKGV
jgi:hypothetical protein